ERAVQGGGGQVGQGAADPGQQRLRVRAGQVRGGNGQQLVPVGAAQLVHPAVSGPDGGHRHGRVRVGTHGGEQRRAQLCGIGRARAGGRGRLVEHHGHLVRVGDEVVAPERGGTEQGQQPGRAGG